MNKETVLKYIDGFNKSDHEQILSCLTDDVEWRMPGAFQLSGKEAFDREIENDSFMGSPIVRITRMTEENNIVIAEGTVRAAWKEGGFLNAVFCDVFEMENNKIKRLITYQVNLRNSTSVKQHIKAPREKVYRALVDAEAIRRRKVPTGMNGHVHDFDGREGGTFRVSLTYDDPSATGKTTSHTDTYHGRFVTLVPNEKVVEAAEFETEDPALRGEMTVTITLADADGGTDVLAVHEGLPPGVLPADNEVGWKEALAKLATLVEAD